jgi:transposase
LKSAPLPNCSTRPASGPSQQPERSSRGLTRAGVNSEAAFAAIAGVNPVPASSGNTTRHPLNRGGDRQLNRALNVIAMVRMVHDPGTGAYVDRRRAEGKTDREIRRILKRYLARSIYRHLNAA